MSLPRATIRRRVAAPNWEMGHAFLVEHLPNFIVLDLIPIRELESEKRVTGRSMTLFEARLLPSPQQVWEELVQRLTNKASEG